MRRRSPSALVRACRRGEADAWDELLERYGRLVWAMALRLGAREEEAAEIFQGTWVALVEGIGSLRDPARLASWVAGTARFQTYHLFDEARRRRRLEALDEHEEAEERPAAGPSAQDLLERLEQEAAVRDALERLGGRCRELLELLFFHEPQLDYETISSLTGLAVGSIGPIRARCLSRLRPLLDSCIRNGRPATPEEEK